MLQDQEFHEPKKYPRGHPPPEIVLDFTKTTGHIIAMPKPNVRDQIINASLATLHSKGFNATSVQDITDAAGVPKGSFYNHFASKEVLGVEVVKLYAERAVGYRSSLDDASLAPLARIEQDFRAMVQANVDSGFACGCLLGNFSTELSSQSAMIREQVELAYQEWADALAQTIAAAQQDGSVPDDWSAAERANAIINTWQGAVARSKAAHGRAPLDLFLKIMMGKLLQ
jgi:TetR/AcrR family transcriptional repressor of nem operon